MKRFRIENVFLRAAAIVVALGVISTGVWQVWPSPLNAEFQLVAGESLENTIDRLQQRKDFLEAQKVKASDPDQRLYWSTEFEKVKKLLDSKWRRKFKK